MVLHDYNHKKRKLSLANLVTKHNIKLVMKKILMIAATCYFLVACSSNSSTETNSSTSENEESTSSEAPDYDPNRGEGKFTSVDLGTGLNTEMAIAGETAYGVKCSSCHKLSDERLVGPGWAGVTTRRKPEWIMNFITNPDPMINKDPEVQAQLELCLVRMPNQNLTDDEARNILEFMRKNDGVN